MPPPTNAACPLGPRPAAQDTVGSATWLDTQRTHEPAIQERKAQLPVQYEEWVGPHFDAEQARNQGWRVVLPVAGTRAAATRWQACLRAGHGRRRLHQTHRHL